MADRAVVLGQILSRATSDGTNIEVDGVDVAYGFLCRWGRASLGSQTLARNLPKLRERAQLNRQLAYVFQAEVRDRRRMGEEPSSPTSKQERAYESWSMWHDVWHQDEGQAYYLATRTSSPESGVESGPDSVDTPPQ